MKSIRGCLRGLGGDIFLTFFGTKKGQGGETMIDSGGSPRWM